MTADVVIIGASVAGCATALGLARRGVRAIVIDRAATPRDKPCGEGILPHGVGELRALGLYDRVAPLGRPFAGIGYHVDEHSAVGRFARGPGLAIRRLALDHALNTALVDAGVEVRRGVVAREFAIDADGVRVQTDAGELRGRLLIGADGLHSQVRRGLGLHNHEVSSTRFGARWHVRVADRAHVRDVVDVYLADRFEVYVTPVADDVLNLAVLCGRDVSTSLGGDLPGGLRALVDSSPALRAALAGSVDVSAAAIAGPLRQSATALVADRAVLVGDAAGFVDAITGEGMSLALAGARVATDVIAAALRTDQTGAESLRPYELAHRRAARDRHRLAELVLWWSRRRWLARGVIAVFARAPRVFGRVLGV